MMALLIELYLFIPLSVTMTTFQGHSNVKQLYLNFVVVLLLLLLIRLKWKLCRFVK